jgi:PST family polysaccharide transporter/teichuronic acid exporter
MGRQYKTLEYKNLCFKYVSIFEIIAATISLVAGIILAINDFGVYALVYATIIQFFILNIFLLVRGLNSYGLSFHFFLRETKPFVKIGAYQAGGQVVNYFNRDIDILLIGKFFGADILGGYSLAKQLILRPAQIINPILTKVASPFLAKYQEKTKLLKEQYLKLVNIVATVNIPIYLLILLFSPFFITILYGDEYTNISGIVRILSLYMIFRAIGNPIGSLVVATGRTDKEFVWNLFTLIIIPMAIFIGSQFTIEIVALSLVLTMILLFVPSWWFLVRPLVKASLREYIEAIMPNPFRLMSFIRGK